jgi:hypothetical protein
MMFVSAFICVMLTDKCRYHAPDSSPERGRDSEKGGRRRGGGGRGVGFLNCPEAEFLDVIGTKS